MNSKETPITDLTEKSKTKVKAKRKTIPEYTPAQLETLQVLQRNSLATVAFYFAITVFSIILIAIVASIFIGGTHVSVQLLLTVVDGLIGWIIRTIYLYLFPPICKDSGTGEMRLKSSN